MTGTFMRLLGFRATLVAAMLAFSGAAWAHGISIALRGNGDATVVFHYTDGSVMAGAEYRVFPPGRSDYPVATGATDDAGGVPLHATGDGVWRIEVEDHAGHAARARIDVAYGIASLPGQDIPDWFIAASLFLNVLLVLRIVATRSTTQGKSS